jgi:hypothetical protein
VDVNILPGHGKKAKRSVHLKTPSPRKKSLHKSGVEHADVDDSDINNLQVQSHVQKPASASAGKDKGKEKAKSYSIEAVSYS